jgi:cell division protein FtsZ
MVLGLGGCGCNAVRNLHRSGADGAGLVAADADGESLEASPAGTKILMGPESNGGLGSGGDPEAGRLAALESLPSIMGSLGGAEVVFLACGLGGGTGTPSSVLVAEALSRLEPRPRVVACATTPFSHERTRTGPAREALAELGRLCDEAVEVSNARLSETMPGASFAEVMAAADETLRLAVGEALRS